MNSPAPNVAYHLTAAQVKASQLLIDYEPLGPVEPIKAAFKGKGKGPMKRKHDEINDTRTERVWTTAATATARAAARSRCRTQKSVSCIRFVRVVAVPPPMFPDPLPAAAPVRARTERAPNEPPPQGLRGRRFITQFKLCFKMVSYFVTIVTRLIVLF